MNFDAISNPPENKETSFTLDPSLMYFVQSLLKL